MHIGENLLQHHDPAMIYYSWCAKTPYESHMFCDSELQKSSVMVTLALSLGELMIHAILLAKQKSKKCGISHNESQSPSSSHNESSNQPNSHTEPQNDPDITLELPTDNEPGLILPDVLPEVNNQQQPANHHYLVTPMAHLIKAIFNLVHVLPLYIHAFGVLGPTEGLIVARDLAFFLNPHVNFLVFPLVDIICNRNLRTNFRNIISFENIRTYIDWRVR